MNAPTDLSANAHWQQRSLASVWHPCTQMARAARTPPLAIARGQGAWLHDHEGRRYFDAISSWWVNLFGHADPGINAAITADVFNVLTVEASVASRKSFGGTAPDEVRKQIAWWRARN